MEAGEFVRHLQDHRHSHFASAGVDTNRWGARSRESVGQMESHGSIWFCTAYDPRDYVNIINCGVIPQESINASIDEATENWNEDLARWRGQALAPILGWRPALKNLLRQGYLRPSSQLSWLLGEDTYDLVLGRTPEWAS